MALNDRTRIIDTQIEDEMKTSYIDYSMSVIVSRALPDVRDGLKPVAAPHPGRDERPEPRARAAATGSAPRSPATPRATTTRTASGVVYPTLVRLAQDLVMRYPLVDGQGNFGSIDGDAPAAMRYTEARLTPPRGGDARATSRRTRSTSGPTTTRRREEPVVLPARRAQPAGQRLRRASPSAWRPRSRRTTSREVVRRHRARHRQPGARRSTTCCSIVQGPGLPDRRHHLRHARASATATRPAAASSGCARACQVEEGRAGRDEPGRHRDPVPGQQGEPAREDRRPGARGEDHRHLATCATSPTATACAS